RTPSANMRRRVTACATVEELHHGRQCSHQGPNEAATVQEKILASYSGRSALVPARTRLQMRWPRFKRKFSRHTAVAKRFSSLGRAFLGAPGQGQARWLLGVLLALCLAVGGGQGVISSAARDFLTALGGR